MSEEAGDVGDLGDLGVLAGFAGVARAADNASPPSPELMRRLRGERGAEDAAAALAEVGGRPGAGSEAEEEGVEVQRRFAALALVFSRLLLKELHGPLVPPSLYADVLLCWPSAGGDAVVGNFLLKRVLALVPAGRRRLLRALCDVVAGVAEALGNPQGLGLDVGAWFAQTYMLAVLAPSQLEGDGDGRGIPLETALPLQRDQANIVATVRAMTYCREYLFDDVDVGVDVGIADVNVDFKALHEDSDLGPSAQL